MIPSRAAKHLRKKAKQGFRGYPLATVIFYGPDDQRATKVAVGIIRAEGQPTSELKRWFATSLDARNDPTIAEEVSRFITEQGVRSVGMFDRIYGCPHEEGIDYEGPTCPKCPFWAGRDRATGQQVH
jgi:hypothetical protein